MPKRVKMYPYEVTDGIVLRIKEPFDPLNDSVELQWVPTGETPDEQLHFDLRGNEQWGELMFGIEARLDVAELTKILPAGVDYRTETALLVSVRCPSTKIRYPVQLTADPKEPGLWSGDIHLHRHNIRSRVELHPILTRTTDIPSSASIPSNISRSRFSLIGSGRAFVVSTDYVERTFDSPVKVRWEDFRQSKNSWRACHGASIYFLEPDPDEPILWLNSYTPSLKSLLLDRTEKTTDAGLRVFLAAWLAETVWLQLFHVALGSVTARDNDEGGSFPEGWRGDVLRRYLGLMFPDIADDATASLTRALAMRESQDESATLVSLAMTATQDIVTTQKQFKDAVRHIERAE